MEGQLGGAPAALPTEITLAQLKALGYRVVDETANAGSAEAAARIINALGVLPPPSYAQSTLHLGTMDEPPNPTPTQPTNMVNSSSTGSPLAQSTTATEVQLGESEDDNGGDGVHGDNEDNTWQYVVPPTASEVGPPTPAKKPSCFKRLQQATKQAPKKMSKAFTGVWSGLGHACNVPRVASGSAQPGWEVDPFNTQSNQHYSAPGPLYSNPPTPFSYPVEKRQSIVTLESTQSSSSSRLWQPQQSGSSSSQLYQPTFSSQVYRPQSPSYSHSRQASTGSPSYPFLLGNSHNDSRASSLLSLHRRGGSSLDVSRQGPGLPYGTPAVAYSPAPAHPSQHLEDEIERAASAFAAGARFGINAVATPSYAGSGQPVFTPPAMVSPQAQSMSHGPNFSTSQVDLAQPSARCFSPQNPSVN